MTFIQLTARLKNFLRGWLLALGIKEGMVECATLCVRSEVMLMYIHSTEVIMPLQDSVVNEYGSISHHGHYSDNDPKKKKPSYGSHWASVANFVKKPPLKINFVHSVPGIYK